MNHRRLLRRVLRERRGTLVRLLAWSVVEAVPAFLTGRLLAAALDHGFLAGRLPTGFGWLGVMAVAALVGAVGTRQTMLRLADVVEPFRDELVDLVVTGVLRRSTGSGEPGDTAAVARLTHQVEIVRESFATVIMMTQGFVVTTTSALLGMLTLVPGALVLVLPPLLLGLALFVAALPALAARQRDAILADEDIATATDTAARSLRDIVACGGEDEVRATTGTAVTRQEDAGTRLARATAWRSAALGISSWGPLLAILFGAPWLVSRGASTGTVLGALAYVSMGLQPALRSLIRGVGGAGLWLLVTVRRVTEAADAPGPPRDRGAWYGGPTRRPGVPVLELSGVTFAHGPHAVPVLSGLDLVVPDGDHLVVVGPSGVGKSTLGAVAAGLLEPQAGVVRLGGVPLHAWTDADLVRSRVLIPQEAYVFTGTVAENLTYLNPDATPHQIAVAVDAVGAGPLVVRLGGYRATVTPAMLSAGERQLLTLARAYLSPAELVMLDEATCHLDPAADRRVERAFAARPGALVVMAHRISSALRARRVLVLDGNRPRLGTHDELLRTSAQYRDLVGHWNPAVSA